MFLCGDYMREGIRNMKGQEVGPGLARKVEMAQIVVETSSEDETREVGKIIGAVLEPGDVVALTGDLGSGKTRLAQGIGAGLGVEGHITSPTFTVVAEHSGRVDMYHMDVYRLSGPEDLEDIGFYDYLDMGGVVVIEWADLVAEALGPETLWVKVERVMGSAPPAERTPGRSRDALADSGLRRITVTGSRERFERVFRALSDHARGAAGGEVL